MHSKDLSCAESSFRLYLGLTTSVSFDFFDFCAVTEADNPFPVDEVYDVSRLRLKIDYISLTKSVQCLTDPGFQTRFLPR